MSIPRDDYQNKLGGVIAELNSAMSALNMPPSTIETPALGEEDAEPYWLSNNDRWVAHAYAHLRQALYLACDVIGELDELKLKVALLEAKR